MVRGKLYLAHPVTMAVPSVPRTMSTWGNSTERNVPEGMATGCWCQPVQTVNKKRSFNGQTNFALPTSASSLFVTMVLFLLISEAFSTGRGEMRSTVQRYFESF